jgi:hypothetical protein
MRHKLIMTLLMGSLILLEILSICLHGFDPNNATIIMLAIVVLLHVYKYRGLSNV